MAQDQIRYDLHVQEALRGAVRKILSEVARDGLPGDHHFFISFRTRFPGVRLSARMRERYPDDMTIVLQHQFWDLAVTDYAFEVSLSFSGVSERLLVPFEAVTGFFDPSVDFGLKFETDSEATGEDAKDTGSAATPKADADKPRTASLAPARRPVPTGATEEVRDPPAKVKPAAKAPPPSEPAEAGAEAGAEVVSLDAFRKKT
ncbi:MULTISPECIES: ClpXP protease specificity-enhancing factor SspB [unclassified Chelatococcus]|uniref:SspB family protein n=1 Tax=unclassified Chelatococcus TaxID=2638111 RepID=UPI001BCB3DAF|nr:MULTISPECIES: ClpXP protease specificity-enhancing factor SspB [unclassified Chelatococcus]MBS7697939.1 Stringent starvation protein B [Chelatococcus sp. YT9]MBX3558484.1 Stringent starvation protein B [Chelatococcus sp.]